MESDADVVPESQKEGACALEGDASADAETLPLALTAALGVTPLEAEKDGVSVAPPARLGDGEADGVVDCDSDVVAEMVRLVVCEKDSVGESDRLELPEREGDTVAVTVTDALLERDPLAVTVVDADGEPDVESDGEAVDVDDGDVDALGVPAAASPASGDGESEPLGEKVRDTVGESDGEKV